MRRRAVLLAAALLAAGCGAPEEQTTAAWDPPDPGATAAPATLAFTGKTLDGKPYDARVLAGLPTVLWFWAPWCATCASEAQSVRDLEEQYRGKVNFLGIAGLGDNKAMHQFVDDFELSAVPHLDDQAGAIWKKFKITQQSLYVVLDKTGKVRKTGYLDDLQLTAEVKSLAV
ncbi:thiol:disulfide interchange protein [Paractinoplanes deccanensis]|uniref:Thiol:disulfide interchange protein n=1 Tax=Paractinoplanes deccanensis TaxID=113561 RepID=A0ABQ3XXZ5_9ACTN|nr:redoxin family protein [Actinoplanes deccanensis]GID72612.1 thiol:disulfide interchange protein [Actinoplanes deccanensis]